jgi:hypothetical protein
MNAIRTAVLASTLAALGAAQAGEITQFPLEKSTLSRSEVRAGAHPPATVPGELYDGSRVGAHADGGVASIRSRAEVRAQARTAREMGDAARFNDLVGGGV